MAQDAGCDEVFDVEDVAEGEEVRIDGDIDGEIEPVKMATDPGKPTERQVEEHRRTHLPYRSWCRWCVLGRGRGLQHRARLGSIVPIVGIDYFFLTSNGMSVKEKLNLTDDKIEEARASGKLTKCFIVRCHASKAIFGHVIPR